MKKLSIDSLPTKGVILLLLLMFLSVSPVIPRVIRGIGFFLIAISMLVRCKKVPSKKVLLISLFLIIFTVSLSIDAVAIFDYGLNTYSLFYIPLCVIIGFLISVKYTYAEFMRAFEAIILALSSIALLLFIGVIIFPFLVTYMPSYTFGGFTHKTLYVLNILLVEGSIVYRNAGFASEPGLYQLFLNMALYYRWSKLERINLPIIIYVLSIITTDSTIGLATMVFILTTSRSWKTRFALVIVILAFMGQIVSIYIHHISYRLFGSPAFDVRISPTIEAFIFSLDNLFGIGAIVYTHYYEALNIGGWDSYSQLVLRYGYQGLALVLLCLWWVFRFDKKLSVIFALTFTAQSIWFLPVISCFYFWAFGKRYNKSKKGELRYEEKTFYRNTDSAILKEVESGRAAKDVCRENGISETISPGNSTM